MPFPGLANLWMVIVKNTPLVSVVGLEDFIRAAARPARTPRNTSFFFGLVIAVYLVLSGVSMAVQARIETRLTRNLSFGHAR